MSTDYEVWTTQDGDRIAVADIEDSHLRNIERFLLGRAKAQLNPSMSRDERWNGWYSRIRDEMERRGVAPHTEDHPEAVRRHQAVVDYLQLDPTGQDWGDMLELGPTVEDNRMARPWD